MTDMASTTTIELRLPAELSRSFIVRALTGSIAVAEDFDLDDIADLRLAVDEVCSTVVPHATPGSAMTCGFALDPLSVRFSAEVECADRPHVETEGSFGWRVLNTLTDEAAVRVTEPVAAGSPYLLRMSIRKQRDSGRR